MKDGGETKRPAPRELVGQRLGEQLAHGRRLLPGDGLELGLRLDQPPQHLHGVTVNVEVVVGVLLDAAEGLELGQ